MNKKRDFTTAKFCSVFALFTNIFLFIIKTVAGALSNSVSVISDALNSLTDIIASIAIMIAVKVSGKKPDANHQFGHGRAEPVAGLIVAIITAFLGIEVVRNAVASIFSRPDVNITNFTALVVSITLFLKLFMYFFFKTSYLKHKFHPSLKALSIDSINDVWISILILVGFLLYQMDFHIADSIVGIFIGLWILKSGFDVGIENSGFLMGRKPPEAIIEHIKKTALSIEGIRGVNDIFAQYVGPYVHVEVHIEVDKSLRVVEAHDLGKKVKKKVEKYKIVDRAFVHIDPRKSAKKI